MCVRTKSWKIIYFLCVELLLVVVGVFYVEPLKYHREFIVCVKHRGVCGQNNMYQVKSITFTFNLCHLFSNELCQRWQNLRSHCKYFENTFLYSCLSIAECANKDYAC